jgi:site-specific recombinase XerD
MSQQGLAKLVRRYASVAGLPQRLAHPHALRGYYANDARGASTGLR